MKAREAKVIRKNDDEKYDEDVVYPDRSQKSTDARKKNPPRNIRKNKRKKELESDDFNTDFYL